jgi:CRISPR/Cas system-associated protein Cas5 (RAMP superfamily)
MSKEKLNAMSMFYSFALLGENMDKIKSFASKKSVVDVEKKEKDRELKRQLNKSNLAKSNGLKEFSINGVIVFAINKKNAEKKYKKIINL